MSAFTPFSPMAIYSLIEFDMRHEAGTTAGEGWGSEGHGHPLHLLLHLFQTLEVVDDQEGEDVQHGSQVSGRGREKIHQGWILLLVACTLQMRILSMLNITDIMV